MRILSLSHILLVFLFSHVYLPGSSTFAHPPTGIAVDAHGNVFFVDILSNSVFKVSPAGEISVVVKLVGFPHSLALDARGNLFVGEYDSNRVVKLTPEGKVGIFASLERPCALAVDVIGNVYVSQDRNNVITKITPDGITNRLSEINSPRGITVDTLGNIFVAADRDKVFKISRTGQVTILAEGLGMPWGVALDKGGNVCVAEYSRNRVSKILLQEKRKSIQTLATLDAPSGVALGNNGDVYVLDGWEKPLNLPKIYIHRINASGVVTTLMDDR